LVAYLYQVRILYSNVMLIIFNCSLWLPQIYLNYKTRSRQTPNLGYVIAATLCHSFLPLYIKGCPYNLLDKEPNYPVALFIAAYMAGQVLLIYYQQKKGARFFVPREWRRDPNAYNYFRHFELREEEINDEETNTSHEEVAIGHKECVICMA